MDVAESAPTPICHHAVLPLLLVVAPESGEPSELTRNFASSGFKAYAVNTLDSAFAITGQWEFDGVLLDADGRWDTVLRSLPEFRYRIRGPIILLSTEGSECLQMEALRCGATEVIIKPASAPFIAAKLHRLLDMSGRASGTQDSRSRIVRLGPLTIDPRRATALVGESLMQLTGSELQVLLLLASQPGEFFHRGAIARTIGQGETRRSADMHICRLRKKLRLAGVFTLHIDTAYGIGYRIKLGTARDGRTKLRNAVPFVQAA